MHIYIREGELEVGWAESEADLGEEKEYDQTILY